MKNVTKVVRHLFSKMLVTLFATLALAGMTAGSALAGNDENEVKFDLVRSSAVVNSGPNVLPNARGRVKIESVGPVEIMDVKVWGLPANTDFDFFVIQVPNAPFGLSWYQGDIETNRNGVGHGTFIGRFSIETFIVAPGATPAPQPHSSPPFPDASMNPQTAPIHTFHLGLWFDDPKDATSAGLLPPGAVTPFNGEHNAGLQVLSTRNFPDLEGPLINVE
jgi:hypothetical protein